jgi:SAM-dependent methyltransferase
VTTSPEITRLYDELLSSSVLDHDRYARPTLHVYRPRHMRMFDAIRKYLPAGQRSTIADIGCQNGFFLRLASQLGFRDFLAVDYFPLPPERSFLTGLSGARFLKANFNEDDFLRELGDRSVDCVVSTEVFEHIFHYPLGYLLECWRVLSNGGLLLLTTPNPCTLANAFRLATGKPISWGDVAFAKTPKTSQGGLPLAVWDIHFREYAASQLEEIVKELPGVQVREAGYLANGPEPTEPLMKRAVKRLVWGAGGGGWRPVSATQYMILQKKVSGNDGVT